MARVIYTKRRVFKLFGIKIVEFNTNYSERSTERDTSDDEFYIELKEVENALRN